MMGFRTCLNINLYGSRYTGADGLEKSGLKYIFDDIKALMSYV
jgi:hypothetical protein